MRKAFTAVAIAHQATLLPGAKFRLSGLLKEFQHWGPELGDLEERGLIKRDSAPGASASEAGGMKTGYRVSAGILLAWMADELLKAARSDQPFERWLQEQRIEGAFLSNKEEKVFKEAVTAAAKVLGNGATAIIEAFGSAVAGKVV